MTDDARARWQNVIRDLDAQNPRLADEILGGLERLVTTGAELAQLAADATETSPPPGYPKSAPRPARPVSRSTPSSH